MPDETREFHKYDRLSHTLLSVNCLYQMNGGGCQGEVYEVGAGAWSLETHSEETTGGVFVGEPNRGNRIEIEFGREFCCG
jgi:hypothetical protein